MKWQEDVWRFLDSLPPLPEGYERVWYTTRKGYRKFFDRKKDEKIHDV